MTIMITFSIAFLLLLGCSYAALLSSPEPMMDPLSRARLLVVPAGAPSAKSLNSERILQNGASICPLDYPVGFTIRCDVVDDKHAQVQFFVNGVRVQKGDRSRLIAGAHVATGAANAWRTEMRDGEVKCRYGAAEEVYARVRIEC